MKVSIVGGGHIGTTLMCYIKHTYPDYWVSMYTRRPELFAEEIKCNDIEKNESYHIKPDVISDIPEKAVKNADIVFIALPHFAVERAFEDIASYVSEKAFIGVLPGGGGCEFFFNKYFGVNNTLFGFQRVPFTAKLTEYGKETNLKSWKPYSVVGTLQSARINQACELIESCGLKTRKASNFLEVALTPSNPLLHTSRTYELFGKYSRDYLFPEKVKFYVGWTNDASYTLFKMDEELHSLLDEMTSIDTSAIRPLSEHYEATTISALTAKINSIPTFQSVFAPMKKTTQGYVADVESRMFTEDFSWGLAVIRSYFDIFDVKAPTMDKLLGWYADYMGLEWFIDGHFRGKDIDKTGAIQNYGINTKEELLSIYID